MATLFCIMLHQLDIKTLQLLIKLGASVNCQNKKDKFSSLRIAAGQKHWEIVGLLIKENANPNARDYEGNTPLHFVAVNNGIIFVVLVI